MGSPEGPTLPLDDFERLVRHFWPKIFRFAMASLRDWDAAQTVTQDCFLRAYLAIPSFRGTGALQAWLMSIAANLVRDYRRSKQTRFWQGTQEIALDTTYLNPTVEEQYFVREQVARIWRVAKCLPKQQRRVFQYRFLLDMDTSELAAFMGLTEGSVKQHLFRAIQRVRRTIEPS